MAMIGGSIKTTAYRIFREILNMSRVCIVLINEEMKRASDNNPNSFNDMKSIRLTEAYGVSRQKETIIFYQITTLRHKSQEV